MLRARPVVPQQICVMQGRAGGGFKGILTLYPSRLTLWGIWYRAWGSRPLHATSTSTSYDFLLSPPPHLSPI